MEKIAIIIEKISGNQAFIKYAYITYEYDWNVQKTAQEQKLVILHTHNGMQHKCSPDAIQICATESHSIEYAAYKSAEEKMESISRSLPLESVKLDNISSDTKIIENAKKTLDKYASSTLAIAHKEQVEMLILAEEVGKANLATAKANLATASTNLATAKANLATAKAIKNPKELKELKELKDAAASGKDLARNNIATIQMQFNHLISEKFKNQKEFENLDKKYKTISSKLSEQTKTVSNLKHSYNIASKKFEEIGKKHLDWESIPIRTRTITHHTGHPITVTFKYNSDNEYIVVTVNGVPDLTREELLNIFQDDIFTDTSNAFTINPEDTISDFDSSDIVPNDENSATVYINCGDFGDVIHFTQKELDITAKQIAENTVVQEHMVNISPEFIDHRDKAAIAKELQRIDHVKETKRGYFAREKECANKAAIVIQARKEFLASENAGSVDGKEAELRWHFTNSRECSFITNGIAITVNFRYMSENNNTIRATLSGYTTDIGGDILLNAFNLQYSTKSEAFFLDPIDANAIIINCELLGMKKKDFTLKVLQDIVKNCEHAIKKNCKHAIKKA